MRLIKAFIGRILFIITKFLHIFIEAYYLSLIRECGEDVVLYPRVSFVGAKFISIGSHTHIGESCMFRATEESPITIGNWVQIANNVIVSTGGHIIDGGLYYGRCAFHAVHIEDNVWIGSNAIILEGVTIGENSVIGAGAVVVKIFHPIPSQ